MARESGWIVIGPSCLVSPRCDAMSAESIVASFVVGFAFRLVMARAVDLYADTLCVVIEIEDVSEERIGVLEAHGFEVLSDGRFGARRTLA